MPLRKQITENSLNYLLLTRPEFMHNVGLLTEVNKIAALADIPLSMQSNTVLTELFNQFKNLKSNLDIQSSAQQIYGALNEIMDRETFSNQQQHQQQGHFDLIGLHKRATIDQLQDHDMTRLMPRPTGNIEVLASVNRFSPSSANATSEGIIAALNDQKINHIFIPVGPGHWRGVYLTKPSNLGENFKVEIFDPMGPTGAETIRQPFVEDLLGMVNIAPNKCDYSYSGPPIRQTDGYACGDFVCAYSHTMMQKFQAPVTQFGQELIDVLENNGNDNGELRAASRKISAQIEAASSKTPLHEAKATESKVAETKAAETKEAETKAIVTKPASETTEAKEHLDSYSYIKHAIKLTPEEKAFVERNTTKVEQKSELMDKYSEELVNLRRARGSDTSTYQQALRSGASKEKEKDVKLTDEELAAKLQEEEFKNPSMKR